MTSVADLKELAWRAIDKSRGEIQALVEDIGAHAELRYKEHRTVGPMALFLGSRGLEVREGLALIGVRADFSLSAPVLLWRFSVSLPAYQFPVTYSSPPKRAVFTHAVITPDSE